MKRQGKMPFRFYLFAVAIILLIFGSYFLYFSKKPAPSEKHEIVESFPFSDKSDIAGWDEKILSEKGTEYSLEEQDGLTYMKAVSEDSASALFHKIRLFRARNPFLSWKWRIEEFPTTVKEDNLKKKSQFDFAAQVYVVFKANFLPKARAIQYVWTRDVDKGTVAQSPYTKNVKTIVLESGDAGIWKSENRDIGKDYLMLFGEELEKDVMAISFMTDSDSTSSRAVAGYTDITVGYLGKERKENPSDI
ncbi:MAG: DUF3047 domain-containing protein [Candidatus Omnitrophota bacterium]